MSGDLETAHLLNTIRSRLTIFCPFAALAYVAQQAKCQIAACHSKAIRLQMMAEQSALLIVPLQVYYMVINMQNSLKHGCVDLDFSRALV